MNRMSLKQTFAFYIKGILLTLPFSLSADYFFGPIAAVWAIVLVTFFWIWWNRKALFAR